MSATATPVLRRGRRSPIPRRGATGRPASIVAAVSGKGGVGKTNLVTNLAVAAAGLGGRVLLVDGDLGLANVDVLLGLVPAFTVADVLEGHCSFEDALLEGPRRVRILPAASARPDLPALWGPALERLTEMLKEAAARYDLVLVDAGAGIGPAVVGLAGASTRALLVTNAEPTSLADAYATVKVLSRAAASVSVDVVVNEARDEGQARSTHGHLERMARRFLDIPVAFRGFLPRDPRMVEAVARQRAVVEVFPSAASSRKLVELARFLLTESRGTEQGKTRRDVPPKDRKGS